MNYVFHPIRTITLLEGYEVLAHFENGDVKKYDFTSALNAIKPLNVLLDDYELFKTLRVDDGGYGVIWNDQLDLSCEDLWINGEDVDSPFKGLMSFREAEEQWELKPSALRKALQYKKLTVGIDVMFFGKQWLITREAMEREYGLLEKK